MAMSLNHLRPCLSAAEETTETITAITILIPILTIFTRLHHNHRMLTLQTLCKVNLYSTHIDDVYLRVFQSQVIEVKEKENNVTWL